MDNLSETLEFKNQELFHNKVDIDLDNNYEALKLLFNNYLELLSTNLSDKVYDITFNSGSNMSKEIIMDTIIHELTIFFNELNKVLGNKYAYLKSNIDNLNIANYQEYLNKENIKVIESIKSNISKFVVNLKVYFSDLDSFSLERLTNLLNSTEQEIITYLINTIHEKDLVLISNYQDNVNRLDKMNSVASKVM